MSRKNGKGYVIVVNDNPNIGSGIEDKYLSDELYRLILTELLEDGKSEQRVVARIG